MLHLDSQDKLDNLNEENSFVFDGEIDLKNWMQKLPSSIKLTQILFPCSHNSGAYQTEYDGFNCNNKIFQILGWISRKKPKFKHFLNDWTLTQTGSIHQQLEVGIRCFDLRVSCFNNDQIHVTHTFPCLKLESALLQMKDFLETHQGEIILIYVKEDWEHRKQFLPKHGDKMLKVFQSILGSMLCSSKDFHENITLQEMVQRNQRVFLFNGVKSSFKMSIEEKNEKREKLLKEIDIFDDLSSLYFDYDIILGHWLNTSNIDEAFAKLQKRFDYIHEEGITLQWKSDNRPFLLKEISYVLTATNQDIKKAALHSFFPSLFKPPLNRCTLFELTESINKKVESHLQLNQEKLQYVNIITLDFVNLNVSTLLEIVKYNFYSK